MGCIICQSRPCDPHHIKSRGTYGGDKEYNLLPVCSAHYVEVHQIGLVKFAEKYKQVKSWLRLNKWQFDGFMNKYIHVGTEGWEDD